MGNFNYKQNLVYVKKALPLSSNTKFSINI
jgi:hypothetical protein